MKKPKLIIQDEYKNIYSILNEKSNYLKNLEKRRNDGMEKIKEKKKEIFFEDYFNLNKFRRDYSCFSSDTLQENTKPVKFHISHNINIHSPKKFEKDFLIINEDFPLKRIRKANSKITLDFPKRKIYFNNINLKKRKKLENIGREIISKNIYK